MQDEITVTLEPDDIGEAYKPPPRRRRLGILILTLAIMLAVLIVTLLVQVPEARPTVRDDPITVAMIGVIVFLTIVIALILGSARWVRRYVGRSTINDHPGMSDPVQYRFDDEQFEARSTYSQAHYPWNLLWNWRETSRAIIVFPTPRNFYVIPKRAADEAVLDRLRDRLKQARKYKPGQ